MKKMFLALVLVVLTVFVAAGCDKGEYVRFSSTGPLTKENSNYGLSVERGIRMAVAEMNEAGGIKVGEKTLQVKFEMLDDEADGTKAKNAFATLQGKTDVFLGAVTSGATKSIVEEAIKTGIPIVSPSATEDSLTVGNNDREGRSNIFRACFNDSLQGVVMANLAKKLDAKKILILVNSDSSYSTGLAEAFKNKATAIGLPTCDELAYTGATDDFESVASQVNSEKYDCIFLPDYYAKAKTIVTTLRSAGYTGAFLGADGWDGILDYIGNDLAALSNCYFSNHYAADSTDEKVQAFIANYKKVYGFVPDSFAVLGYDAAYIAAQAVEEAGSLDFDKVVAALTTGTFECVTGTIKYDANGNPLKKPVIIKIDTAEDGSYKFYEQGSIE